MLNEIIAERNLTASFCADLIGASEDHFKEWALGTRPVPSFIVPELVSIFGVSRERLLGKGDHENIAPSGNVWFKLRQDGKCNQADLEMVGMARKLCFRVGQFLALQGKTPEGYRDAFQSAVNASANEISPARQGKIAARMIRAEFGWTHGSTGIGDWIRSNLRAKGLVVVESPFRDALVEGCTFLTEGPTSQMICLFVNTFGVTWFRRNAVLLHELCHAIFDLGNSVAIDYRAESGSEVEELRAEAFAMECLTPRETLSHFQNQFGFDWKSVTPRVLARLIAACQAPQQLILKAALEYSFIDSADFVRYSQFECGVLLSEFTTHGLTTKEYQETLSAEERRKFALNRYVSFGGRKLLLPLGYVTSVVDALNSGHITPAKAAELMLMEKNDFRNRFSSVIHQA